MFSENRSQLAQLARDETLTVYLGQLGAEWGDTVRAKPIGAVGLKVGVLFDDEE